MTTDYTVSLTREEVSMLLAGLAPDLVDNKNFVKGFLEGSLQMLARKNAAEIEAAKS